MSEKLIQRDSVLTESSLATIYGCCGLFDLCGDSDLMSLSFEGASKFLDWLTWQRTDVCLIEKNFITWARADGAGRSAGYVGDPCADPNGVEWGECDFVLRDFGRLRREGPTRDLTEVNMRLCERQPRYRLDGTAITDDREYDMRIVTEVMMQDLKRHTIDGNVNTPGQWDGLNRLVRYGYTNSEGRRCAAMDSIVIDWNMNDLDQNGGGPVTMNGNPIGPNWGFIDVLMAAFRRIKQRIGFAPALDAAGLRRGDIVLVLPTSLAECVLDAFTCWSVCPGEQYHEANLNVQEARDFRLALNGGMFGDGEISIDGFPIPLIKYDWGLINGANHFDAFLLTGQVGNINTLHYQYLDLTPTAQARPDRYGVTDGGRLLTWALDDHTCEQRVVEFRPRILSWAPWAQVRFQDVVCNRPFDPLSPDPTQTSFFIESSFSVASC